MTQSAKALTRLPTEADPARSWPAPGAGVLGQEARAVTVILENADRSRVVLNIDPDFVPHWERRQIGDFIQCVGFPHPLGAYRIVQKDWTVLGEDYQTVLYARALGK